jgi:probable DNA metabolism protein
VNDVYYHDGTLDGVLTAAAAALPVPGARMEADTHGQGDLFAAPPVPAAADTAHDLIARLEAAGGAEAVRRVLDTCLADRPGFESALLGYIRLTLERQTCVDGWRTHDAVRAVCRLSESVRKEAHRMKGLLRFRELADRSLYAPFAPDHAIVIHVAAHFRDRLRAERWLIHDTRRGLAVLWDGASLHPGVWDASAWARSDARTAPDEAAWQECWRTYIRHIAIGERVNPRLQRQWMPVRYWKYLPEMAGDPAARPGPTPDR